MPTESRRLAAVLAADIAGYSRLMEDNEIEVLTRLQMMRAQIVPACQKLGGRLVSTAGDSLLVEFVAADAAVHAAFELLSIVENQNNGVADSRKMLFRVGINLGDVIGTADGDIFGTGVNVAARLEGLAEAGGLCLSDDTYQQVQPALSLDFDDLGMRQLKNISRPVRCWCWPSRQGRSHTPAQSVLDQAAMKPTIAILPFRNLSPDPDDDYFAEGVADQLINELSRSSYVRVVARSSSFSFRDRDIDLNEIGGVLGAQYCLEGSVRRAGDRVRVSVQLSSASSALQIWSNQFDKDISDIFEIQDEIVSDIFSSLIQGVIMEEQSRARLSDESFLSAQDRFWRGTWHYQKMTQQDMSLGRTALKEAIRLCPEHGQAHDWLAVLEINSAFFGWHDAPEKAVADAYGYAMRGVELDRYSADAHVALATVQVVSQQWDEARETCRRALELAPSNATAHFLKGAYEAFGGDADAAVRSLRTAISLSPRDQLLFYFENVLAAALYRQGNYEQAVESSNRSRLYNPHFAFAHFNHAASLAQSGDPDGASSSLSDALKLIPEPDNAFFAFGWPFRDESDMTHLLDGMRKAGVDL